MMSEMADNYRSGNAVSLENKCLREQISRLATDKLSFEESLSQQLPQMRESADGFLKASSDAIFRDLKNELEVQAVDRFKRSPAYDALLLREFKCGMRQSKKFFVMKDHLNEKALRRFDKSLKLHIDGVFTFNTYYSGKKGSLTSIRGEPDLGPITSRDYEPFMPMGDEEVVWLSED
ncbi:hypothetical protein QYF36_019599 [Acer negundo]|nr:hypothetical protein QYF36_019599 [Acer negundo]